MSGKGSGGGAGVGAWRHGVGPWTAILSLGIGAMAVLALRPFHVLAQAACVIAATPFVEARLMAAGRPRWLVWVAMSVLVAVLAVPLYDKMALFVLICLIDLVRDLGLRMLVAAAALMVMAGGSLYDPIYLGASAFQGVILVTWLARRHDTAQTRQGARARLRLSGRIAIAIVLATAAAAATMAMLPAAERWVVEQSVDLSGERLSGFSPITALGQVTQIRASHRLALRVFAPAARLMRGQVYLNYRRGVWSSPIDARPAVPVAAVSHAVAREGPSSRTSALATSTSSNPGVETGATAAAGLPRRERVQCVIDNVRILFAPLGARDVRAGDVPLLRDSEAIYRSAGSPLDSYAYCMGPAPATAPPAAERALLLAIPPALERTLGALVARWTQGVRSDRDRARSILFGLGQLCAYSLSPGWPGKEEPLERFLTKTHKGHCEYFASAMVLLLRRAGIPSRYVTGYSVTEANSFGHYLMARDCDAHAWVEAWLPGEGWTSLDPTPPDWHAEGHTPFGDWLSEVVDAVVERLEAARDAVIQFIVAAARRLSAHRLLALLAAVCLGVVILRRRLAGLWRKLRHLLAARSPVTSAPANPVQAARARFLAQFAQILSRVGVVRRPAETVEEVTIRLAASTIPPPAADPLRELTSMYARARYGTQGWDGALADRLLEALARALAADPGP